jgi:hypothetical protein
MSRLTDQDRDRVQKYFGKELAEITADNFKALKKEAQHKYHPDKFAHLDDEVVLEMAKDRFQEIEQLSQKLEAYLSGEASAAPAATPPEEEVGVSYRSDGMDLEIMTSDADLKFRLFRSRYIQRGDEVRIRGTQARLVSLADYGSRSAGFRENIKLRLAFGPENNLSDIVAWLFRHISGVTSNFVIEGKIVPIEPYAILQAIRRESIRELKA